MTSRFAEIIPRTTIEGTVFPLQPSDGLILEISPRLEGNSVLLAWSLCRLMCRFLGRRVAAFELRALFAGVREAPRHEIAGAVRGWFRQSYGESAAPGRAPGAAERRPSLDVVLPRAGFGRASGGGERRIGCFLARTMLRP